MSNEKRKTVIQTEKENNEKQFSGLILKKKKTRRGTLGNNVGC